MNSRITGIIIVLLLLFLGYYLNNSLLLYSVPYAMGAYIGLFYKNIAQKNYSSKTIIIAALFIVITILCETIYDFEQGVVLMPIRLCQIIAIWILADLLAISTSPKWWMTISFFIYCSHSLILETIEKVFYLTFGNTSRGALIDFMCAPIITLIIIYGLAFYCRKIPKVWGLLVGYRK